MKCTSDHQWRGASITNSCKLFDDVQADISKRNTSIIKFFAFLRNNVKVKVLEACVMSSILYNAETWADTKVDRLEVVYRRMLSPAVCGLGHFSCGFRFLNLGSSKFERFLFSI